MKSYLQKHKLPNFKYLNIIRIDFVKDICNLLLYLAFSHKTITIEDSTVSEERYNYTDLNENFKDKIQVHIIKQDIYVNPRFLT